MAWSESKVFVNFVKDALDRTAAFDLNSDTFKAALYGDITPAATATSANTAYGAGVWTTDIYEVDQWAQGGVALSSPSVTVSSTTAKWAPSGNTASESNATLANVYGCLVYDDTLSSPVADQGVCYNYFGGANTIADGTFTIVWSANGIMSFSV